MGLQKRSNSDGMDWIFARTIQRLGDCDDPWVGVAAALTCRAAFEGHVCLDLDQAQPQALNLPETIPGPPPAPDQWRERLLACRSVGAPGDFRPLILHGRRLYLHRYWHYEQEVAQAILARCSHTCLSGDAQSALRSALERLFPDPASDQARAARVAAACRFSVVSGGPGTGKTYTVGKIILLMQAAQPHRPLQIFLGAPTGKAAARLQTAVESYLAEQPQEGLRPLVQRAQTLHRLLGYMPATAGFRYHAGYPLPADAVIIDEASMIDLVMMRQLIQAVSSQARLILVGDKDQLASVEAGAVLGDICHGITRRENLNHPAQAAPAPDKGISAAPLADRIVLLKRSYRFDARSGLGALGRAINVGDSQTALRLLGSEDEPDIVLKPLTDWTACAVLLEKEMQAVFGPLFDCAEPMAAFDSLNRFKILCAVRKGPQGIEAMNRWVERIMRQNGRIPSGSLHPAEWYAGRPVMVARNDYFHGLFNGDVGVALSGDAEHPELQVIFADHTGGFKSLNPQQLPEHQTVYAMTIHKSQGSEFERVMIVLPAEDSPLLTRELIYTAITRARRSIVIWADPEILARAIERPIERASGLKESLWR